MSTPSFPPRFGPRTGEKSARSASQASSQGHLLGPGSSALESIPSSERALLEAARTQRPSASRPRGLFIPESYECNYAYPLIVWLHDSGRSEGEIVKILPRISVRNYLGLSLRGPKQISPGPPACESGGFAWTHSQRDRLALEDELHASVRHFREHFHVHSERVFLVGSGDGGTMAWNLFLSRPEWFAGVAVLGGRFPWNRRPLRRFRALHGKRLFVTAQADDPADVNECEAIGRLMYLAGLDVAVRCHASGGRQSKAVLRHLDGWIMDAIGGCR